MTETDLAPASTLAQRKRLLVRDELAEAAAGILALRGFEETTVEQITAAVGVSRRTFFRYFQSKEDVVVHMLAGAGAQLREQLRARPPEEPAATALRHTLSSLACFSANDPDRTLHVSRLILRTPALLACFLERQAQWQEDITAVLAQRAGLDPRADLRPALAAGAAMTAFNAALRHWADVGDGQPLADILDQAFAAVAPALDLPANPR